MHIVRNATEKNVDVNNDESDSCKRLRLHDSSLYGHVFHCNVRLDIIVKTC